MSRWGFTTALTGNTRMMTIVNKVFRIGRAQYGAGSSLGPRKTVGFEFVRILKGQVVWSYDNKQYQLRPGDWILSQPNHHEHFLWDKLGDTQHDHFHFTLSELPDDLPRQDSWPLVMPLDASNMMQTLFSTMIDLQRSNHKNRTHLMKLTAQQMLYFWACEATSVKNMSLDRFSKPIQAVMDASQKNWNQGNLRPMPIEEMIKLSCVSRSTFLRAFQQECSDTPTRFFENQRLHMGRLHLLKSNRKVSQISDVLGYSSPFHFSKNFKSLFNAAPKEYKRLRHDKQIIIDDYSFQKVFNLLSSTQTL